MSCPNLTFDFTTYLWYRLDDKYRVIPGCWYMRLIMKDGSPLGETSAHGISQWLRESIGGVIDPKSVALMDRCTVCMRGTLVQGHKTAKCPTLALMNKLRANKDIVPIVVGVNTLIDSVKKKPLTLESLEKKHAQELRDLRSKIGKRSILLLDA